jgi:hypothetical protein
MFGPGVVDDCTVELRRARPHLLIHDAPAYVTLVNTGVPFEEYVEGRLASQHRVSTTLIVCASGDRHDGERSAAIGV